MASVLLVSAIGIFLANVQTVQAGGGTLIASNVAPMFGGGLTHQQRPKAPILPMALKAMNNGGQHGSDSNHSDQNGQHNSRNDLHAEHQQGIQPVEQQMGKGAKKNGPFQAFAQMAMKGVHAVVQPIEFIAQLVLLSPIIWHSLQQTQKSFDLQKQPKEVQTGNKFIQALENLLTLMEGTGEKGKDLQEKVGKILRDNLDEFGGFTKENIDKLTESIVNIIKGKPHKDHSHLHKAEQEFAKSFAKVVELRNELAGVLGSFGQGAVQLAAKGAITIAMVLLAPVVIVGDAYVVFSLMRSQQKQYNHKDEMTLKTKFKLYSIYGISKFGGWLSEVMERANKETREGILKIFKKRGIEGELNENVKESGVMGTVFGQVFGQKTGKNLNELKKHDLEKMEKEKHKGLEVVVESEDEAKILIEVGEEHEIDHLLSNQGLGHVDGEFHDGGEGPHTKGHLRMPRGIGAKIATVTLMNGVELFESKESENVYMIGHVCMGHNCKGENVIA